MQYDKTFKEEAVRLFDEIGSKREAYRLGVPYPRSFIGYAQNPITVNKRPWEAVRP